MTNQMISCYVFNEASKVLPAFSSSGFLAFVKQGFVWSGEANSSEISVEKAWSGEEKNNLWNWLYYYNSSQLSIGNDCNCCLLSFQDKVKKFHIQHVFNYWDDHNTRNFHQKGEYSTTMYKFLN